MILTPKIQKALNIWLRIAISVVALSYLLYRISIIPGEQIEIFLNSVFISPNSLKLLTLIGVLLFINISLEAIKWKLLISNSETVSFFKSIKAVLGGMTVSVFTPNRVGEFLGRIFVLQKTDPLRGILLTIVGSISQLLVTIVFGTISYIIFTNKFLLVYMPDKYWIINGFMVTLILVSLGYSFLFFNISALHNISFISLPKYADRLKTSIEAIAGISRLQLLKVVLISSLRYIVFSSQFFLAIKLMGLSFPVVHCFLVISLLYLVLAAIPSVALSEIGVRGSVAVFLFGWLAGNQGLSNLDSLAVISAATFIWIVNIGIPSLLGVLVIFNLKFFRQ